MITLILLVSTLFLSYYVKNVERRYNESKRISNSITTTNIFFL